MHDSQCFKYACILIIFPVIIGDKIFKFTGLQTIWEKAKSQNIKV